MKIKFNGMKVASSRGCPVCGKGRATKDNYVSVKTFFLPSGASKTFRVGVVEEVSERDAKFLLLNKAFEEVIE